MVLSIIYSRILQKNQLNQYVLAKKVKIKNKIQKKVLTRLVPNDILVLVLSGDGGIGRRAGLRIL